MELSENNKKSCEDVRQMKIINRLNNKKFLGFPGVIILIKKMIGYV